MAARVRPPGEYSVNCLFHPKGHKINTIYNPFSLDENWGAKVENKKLKSNKS